MDRFHAVIVLEKPTRDCPSGFDVVDSTDARGPEQAKAFFMNRPFWNSQCAVWSDEECYNHPAGIFV